MTVPPSSSSPSDANAVLVAAAVSLALFAAVWTALHHGFLERDQIVDTPVYEKYGDAMARGEVPYRDFSLEYPPGALPFFVIPALGHEADLDAFDRTFGALMWACGALALLAMAAALAALRAPPGRAFGALALAAVAPLLLGSIVLTRFDYWPAALAVGAVAALVGGRLRIGHALLGAGIAAKIWPGVVVPLAFAYVWRTRGRREACLCLAVAVAVVLAIVLPFFVLAPGGVWDSVARQTTRPLQIESLGAALLVASHHVFGTSAHMVSGHGSQNLGGTAADIVGAIQSVLQIAVLLAIWIVFARRERTREELVQAAAAAVVAFVALGKVLSPQFLIWLIPLVPLVRSRLAWLLFALALLWTQGWFPRHYWDYALRFASTQSWLVLMRDVLLVVLLVLLLVPDRGVRRRAAPEAAASGRRRASSSPA